MIFKFGEQLVPVEMEEWEADQVPAVFITDSRHADEVLEKAGIIYENEIQISRIGFCRLENQQECVVGTLCIPKLLDVLGSRYRMYFFVNRSNVVIVDDEDFSIRLIHRIQRKKAHQGETKERFLYNYISEFISRDLEMLVAYERRLLRMEEDVSQEKISDFQTKLMPIRRELLNLRSYYDEIMDFTRELEENENGFFLKKHLKYFGTLTDRADRLMSRTGHLLEYAQQVKDACQAQVDARQNSNMQFLTVISTIFFPLTLITGWFGMNFKDMPGLENGYPLIVALSIVVIIVCLIIFKKKHII
ncbi:MAG TPA: cobalt transporter [Candidatus Mediterraneibacter avicola]|nr:cobalt transporter [Candidatus Mediterraneibacter avicola]